MWKAARKRWRTVTCTHFLLPQTSLIRPPLKPPLHLHRPCLQHLYLCPPSKSLLPPSSPPSLSFLFSLPVPIQLAEQQHGESGEPRNLSQPLQLRERLLVGRAHPLTLLPAQLHLRGPVACPGHPLQYRLPWTAHLPGVLPAVQHRQVCNMDREYTHFSRLHRACISVNVHEYFF